MKEVRMCGIDSSSKKTGVSLFINGKYSDHVLLDYSSITDKNSRIDLMISAIYEKLKEWNPSVVYQEEDWNAVNIETTKILSEIIGSVRGYCVANGIFFGKFLPSQWRSIVGIETGKKKRAELKQAAIDLVREKYGIDVNDDVAESICIGNATVKFYEKLCQEKKI